MLEIARAARSGPALLGGSRLITIDGPAASGKSTLAHRLEAELDKTGGAAGIGESTPKHSDPRGVGNAVTIHLDDLYEGWSGLDARLFSRIEAWVILPLANSLSARFLVYDWAQERFTHWDEVRSHPYIIIEGVGAGDVVTRKWATTHVWLDVSDETGLRRGLARDTPGRSTSRASQELHDQWSIWQRRQADYFATSGNRSSADFRIDTTQP